MRTLLLVDLAGLRFGIWEDWIRSIKEADGLHRLPLVPACIAGMSVIDDRTVTIADLAVCIGLPPSPRDKQAHILIMSEEDKMAGFLVAGVIGRAEIPPEFVFPMPAYLSTIAVDTCVQWSGDVIPVINVSAVYNRIKKAEREPPVAEFSVSPPSSPSPSPIENIRLYYCGGEVFASDASGILPRSVRPGGIAGLSLMPHYVRGVAHFEKSAIPVISLAKKMNLDKTGAEEAMLVAELGAERFGFLIDSDIGTVPKTDFVIRSVPPLAASIWLRVAAIIKGEILPVIDLAALMAKEGDSERPLEGRYSPDSEFHLRFGREPVDVVEFLLLGARHALPESEVIDVLDFRGYRRIPNVQPIVAGVMDYNGELLPVIDLAAVFGRRSLVTLKWKMLLVKNGDFKACVLTEKAFGRRRLPQEIHRAVPIVLPHMVVYGCYPDASSVKLVLNVHALSVHFDRSLVKEFLGAISMEMEEAPSELLPAFMPDEYVSVREGVGITAGQSLMEAVSEPPPVIATGSEESQREVLESQAQVAEGINLQEQQALLEKSRMYGGEAGQISVGEVERTGLEPRERESERERGKESESERLEVLEQASSKEVRRLAELEHVKPEAEKREEREADLIRQEPEMIRIEPLESERERESIEAERIRQDAEGMNHKCRQVGTMGDENIHSTLDTRHFPLVQVKKEEEERAGPEPTESESERERAEEGDVQTVVREAEEILRRKEEALTGPLTPPDALQPAAIHPDVLEAEKETHTGSSLSKIAIPAGIIAVVMGLLSYLIFRPALFELEKIVPPVEVSEREGRGRGQDQSGALVPGVAEDSEIDEDVYIVKKGDTLWEISKRYTGSPLNYPRLARENGITNPDLIFPDQKLRIVKEGR